MQVCNHWYELGASVIITRLNLPCTEAEVSAWHRPEGDALGAQHSMALCLHRFTVTWITDLHYAVF